MFVRIVCTEKTEDGNQWCETTYECKRVERKKKQNFIEFTMEDGIETIVMYVPFENIKEGISYEVYYMNNNGRTTDSYYYG